MTTEQRLDEGEESFPVLIGSEIRKARKARGWRLKDFAEASGFSVQYLSEIERGIGGLPLKTFYRLTRLLGLNWMQLIDARGRAKEAERWTAPHASTPRTWPVLLGITFLYDAPSSSQFATCGAD